MGEPMRTALLLLALLVLAALPAQAAPGQGQLEASATAAIWGDLEVRALEGGVAHTADDAAALVVRAPALRVTVITYRNGAEDGRSIFDYTGAVATLQPGAQVLLSPAAPGDPAWVFRATDPRGPPTDVAAATRLAPSAVLAPGNWPFPSDARGPPPTGPLLALHPLAPATVEGPLRVHLFPGGAVRVEGAEGARTFASEARNETRSEGGTELPVVGPVGAQPRTDQVVNVTLLEAPAGAADVPPAAPGREERTTLLARSTLAVQVAGAALLRDAVGAVRVGSEEQRAVHQDVVVGGRFALTAGPYSGPADTTWSPRVPALGGRDDGPRAAYRVEGDLTYLRVAGQTAQDFAPVAIAAGAGAAGLAGLLFLVPAAKFGAAKLLVVPLYTRLRKPEVLEQKRREALLDAIRADPGVNATELGQKLGLGWGNLVYHLGVLERERLVSSTREGRHRRFFPVGVVDHRMHEPLALLRNPSAARVLEVIRAQPGLAQKVLSRQTGLSPSTINWHIERLSDAGLVWRKQEGREVQYFPSDLLNDLAPREPGFAG